MPEGNVKKTRVLVPAITAALVLMIATPAMLSTGAFAQITPTGGDPKDRGLQFVEEPTLTVNKETEDGEVTSASLSATFEVTGAGTGGDAVLTANAEVTQGCLTNEPPGRPGGGQNEPSGLQRTTTTVTGSTTFETEQGHGGGTVTTEAITTPSGGFECPSAQQTEVLVGVEFTDITLTITTNEGKEITATFADQDP